MSIFRKSIFQKMIVEKFYGGQSEHKWSLLTWNSIKMITFDRQGILNFWKKVFILNRGRTSVLSQMRRINSPFENESSD
jgi:hypothetical protein